MPNGDEERRRARGRERRDPFRDVPRAQELTREGIIASAELLRPELLEQIGTTLGGLQGIGALRSGQANVQLEKISRGFTRDIGAIASQATIGAVGAGLQARQIRGQEREARKQRKAALFGQIAGVIGAGVGFATGGAPEAVG